MDTLPTPVSETLEFERSTCSDGAAVDDAFYTMPQDVELPEPWLDVPIQRLVW